MKKLTADQLAEIWEDCQAGEYIGLDESREFAYYIAHGIRGERIEAIRGSIWLGIRDWAKQNGIFLNIWSVNERGNATLWNSRGRSLGGIV